MTISCPLRACTHTYPQRTLKTRPTRVEPARQGLGGSLEAVQPRTPKVQGGESLSQLCDSKPRTDRLVGQKLLH